MSSSGRADLVVLDEEQKVEPEASELELEQRSAVIDELRAAALVGYARRAGEQRDASLRAGEAALACRSSQWSAETRLDALLERNGRNRLMQESSRCGMAWRDAESLALAGAQR